MPLPANIAIKPKLKAGQPPASSTTSKNFSVKSQEQIATIVSILSATASALGVAAQFTDKDLSPITKNLLLGVDVASTISTGFALAEWIRLHNEILDI
ncbi:MAG: hypothetical protein QXL94_00330 [Candidatus Parvarchaeum sp.]